MKNILLITLLFLEQLLAQKKGATPIENSISSRKGSTYALVVGISDYQDSRIPDLNFADLDAIAFSTFLKSKAGGELNGEHLRILLNERATMAQFAIQLDWLLENAKEDDLIYIYFSGHGDVEKKTLTQPGFLLCWDAPSQIYMSGGAFALPLLQEVLTTLSTQNKAKVIFIADACRSGKLSGSSIHGNQLTNANLVRQFNNEIKILSCQPNEYSIEGKQWGNGRGVFSYYLMEGLYGLADVNHDLTVTISELDNYLEENVSKDVAPLLQQPIVMGGKSLVISYVVPEILQQVQNLKYGQTFTFVSTESKGLEEEVFSNQDSSIVRIYRQFKNCLVEKKFLEPSTDCAEYYFQKLIMVEAISRIHSTIKRNYAAALQDDAQQILNYSSKEELREFVLSSKIKALKYRKYAEYLERATELLGENHYMYSHLQARKLFFEGWSLGLEARVPDKLKGNQILEKLRASIAYEANFPQVYKQLYWVFAINFQQADSTEYYANIAVEKSPNWAIPFCELGYLLSEKFQLFDKAKYYLDRAMQIDSLSAYTWNYMGNYFLYIKQYSSAERYYQHSIQIDSDYVDPYYNLACSYSLQNKVDEAYQALEKALKLGYDYKWINSDVDLIPLREDKDRWKRLMKEYFPNYH